MMDNWKWRRKENQEDSEHQEENATGDACSSGENEARDGVTEESEQEAAAVDSCAARLAAAEEALHQSEERYLRVLAEMENLRRRVAREKEEAIKFGNTALAKDLLAFVDNLERALQCAPLMDQAEESTQTVVPDIEAFVQGVRLVAKDVVGMLERHGIRKIVSTGQPFDPTLHQAVAEASAVEGETAGTVKETLQTGYTLNGRLLRAAMVVVTK